MPIKPSKVTAKGNLMTEEGVVVCFLWSTTYSWNMKYATKKVFVQKKPNMIKFKKGKMRVLKFACSIAEFGLGCINLSKKVK